MPHRSMPPPKNRVVGLAAALCCSRKATPKGHFAVYVGRDDGRKTRFVVPTSVLRNALFQELLEKAAEEYGYGGSNKLVIPCDEPTFRGLIASITTLRGNDF